jgi:hypothetical protein
MTRKSVSTKRGSVVQWRKQKRKAALRGLFERKEAEPKLLLKDLAADSGLSVDRFRRRYKQWCAARSCASADEVAAAREAACSSARGGHNRAFTAEQERLLADMVLAATPSMTQPQIVNTALQLHTAANTFVHQTRSRHKPFAASPSFLTRFKRTHRLSSHRTAVSFKPKEKEGENKEEEYLSYLTEVHSSLLAYSPSLVLNMDETPIKMIDAPVTGVVPTGSKEAAKMETSAGSMGTKVTSMPCISAAGDKLPLSVVIRGKTPRCLRKITERASSTVKKVKLYFATKGWTTEDVMLKWLQEVVQPYTASRPAALVLDSFKSHFTPAVQEYAASIHLELIQVPPGATSFLQPLDVSFNGPMLKVRQMLWREEKAKDAWREESQQAAVERAEKAYESMSREATIAAWRKAQLLVE